VFRYRPLPKVAVRLEDGADGGPAAADEGGAWEIERVLSAAARCGVSVEVSRASTESADQFAARLPELGVTRLRVVGAANGGVPDVVRQAAGAAGIHLADDPVTVNGRIELMHYLREQAVCRTLHRYGNLL